MAPDKELAVCFLLDPRYPYSNSSAILESQVCDRTNTPFFLAQANWFKYGEPIPNPDRVAKLDVIISPGSKRLSQIDDLTRYNILTRSPCGYTPRILNEISKLGGTNVLTINDQDLVRDWPVHVSPDFIKRKVGIIEAKDLERVLGDYSRNGKVFLKTLEKEAPGWGTVMDNSLALSSLTYGLPYRSSIGGVTNPRIPIKPDSKLIISEPIIIRIDWYNKNREYRVWVVNNDIATITINAAPNSFEHPIEIRDFAESFIGHHRDKGILPDHYILDTCQTHLGTSVVELNALPQYGMAAKDFVLEEIFSKVLEKLKAPSKYF